MARICPLFSGSGGNCTYIQDGESAIMIDCGVSFKSMSDAALKSGCDLQKLKAVAVTHEHTDHVGGIKVLLKKTGVPLYASAKTLETLIARDLVPSGARLREISESEEIADLLLTRFETSHDCEGSSGYSVILKDTRKITVCTDLGIVTDTVRQNISGSEAIIFESNHDVQMLKNGPYPPQLKLRILSDKGHLSNALCAAELPSLLKSGTTRFILAHLSEHNNLPMLAKTVSRTALSSAGATENEDYILTVAKPFGNGVTAI